MIITFLRHAQCEANVRWSLKRRDTKLTPLGIQQSEGMKGHYDIIFCSPLRRALDTLTNSKLTYDELVVCPEVRECIYSIDDIMVDEQVSDEHFETDEDINERCRHFFRILYAAHKEGCKKNILVLSHFGFICEFTGRYATQRLRLDVAAMKEAQVTNKSLFVDDRQHRASHSPHPHHEEKRSSHYMKHHSRRSMKSSEPKHAKHDSRSTKSDSKNDSKSETSSLCLPEDNSSDDDK